MKGKRKAKPKLTEAMRQLVDYVLEHEERDYREWCEDEGLHMDAPEARNCHVYGSACAVLGVKPSYFVSQAERSKQSQIAKVMARHNEE